MSSHRRIKKAESPRNGIMKSSKGLEDSCGKTKRMQIKIVESKRSISIDNISIERNVNETKREKNQSCRSIDSVKKGCLKEKPFRSAQKIVDTAQSQRELSCKSFKTNRSIKFNEKKDVFVYRSHKSIKASKQEPKQKAGRAPVQMTSGQECCQLI